MQAITKRARAKIAVRIVQQTSVDHLLLYYTGNSSTLATSLLYILKYLYKSYSEGQYRKYTFLLNCSKYVRGYWLKPIIIKSLACWSCMHSENNSISITINKTPLRSQYVYYMLVFEWLMMGYYFYLFGSIISSGSHYQMRILIYCVVFLLFEKIKLSYKYLQFEDPLHLGSLIRSLRWLIYLCVSNLSVLLIRIIYDNKNIHAFLIFVHFLLITMFFVNDASKKNTKLDVNIDHVNLFSHLVTPLSLFIFAKTSHYELSEEWLIEVFAFASNLFVSLEIEKILLMKECIHFGWTNFEEGGKSKLAWNRKRALKGIIIACCVLIVIQNILLYFQKIKYEISVTLCHTLGLALVSYLIYTGRFPFKQ